MRIKSVNGVDVPLTAMENIQRDKDEAKHLRAIQQLKDKDVLERANAKKLIDAMSATFNMPKRDVKMALRRIVRGSDGD